MESRLVDPGWWPPGSCLWPLLDFPVHSRQPSTAFSTSGDGKRPFCTLKIFSFASLLSVSTNFKAPPPYCLSFAPRWGHQWSLWITPHNKLLKDGFLPLTQRDTVRRHFPSSSERRGAPKAKLIVHKLIQPPFGFVYLNETLRPRGCLLRKSQKCQISFFFLFFLSSSSFAFPFFFSLIALQLHDPKILGKHPGSAALLSRSPLLRPPPSFPSLHWDLWFPAQSRWPATFFFLFFLLMKWWVFFVPQNTKPLKHFKNCHRRVACFLVLPKVAAGFCCRRHLPHTVQPLLLFLPSPVRLKPPGEHVFCVWTLLRAWS